MYFCHSNDVGVEAVIVSAYERKALCVDSEKSIPFQSVCIHSARLAFYMFCIVFEMRSGICYFKYFANGGRLNRAPQKSEPKRFKMARLAGLEPAAYGLEVRCSIQLSYRRQSNVG